VDGRRVKPYLPGMDETKSPDSWCPNGHENPAGARFCATCGSALVDEQGKPVTRRRGLLVAVGGGALVAVAAAGVFVANHRSDGGPSTVGTSKASSGTVAISGTLTLRQMALRNTGPCSGDGGYDDIAAGAGVVVRNQAGSVIATSTLEGGHSELTSAGVGYYCHFDFHVINVPSAPFYSIEISHRGAITHSRAELAAEGWHLDITLG